MLKTCYFYDCKQQSVSWNKQSTPFTNTYHKKNLVASQHDIFFLFMISINILNLSPLSGVFTVKILVWQSIERLMVKREGWRGGGVDSIYFRFLLLLLLWLVLDLSFCVLLAEEGFWKMNYVCLNERLI